MAKDLRTHLEALKGSPPEFYMEVNNLLSPEYELSAVLVRLEQKKRFPTVLFNNVKNLLGEPGHRVVMNLTSLRENLAMTCGLDRSRYKMELTKNKVRRPCVTNEIAITKTPRF